MVRCKFDINFFCVLLTKKYGPFELCFALPVLRCYVFILISRNTSRIWKQWPGTPKVKLSIAIELRNLEGNFDVKTRKGLENALWETWKSVKWVLYMSLQIPFLRTLWYNILTLENAFLHPNTFNFKSNSTVYSYDF